MISVICEIITLLLLTARRMEVHNMYYGKLCMIYAHIIREKKLKYITASY